MDASIRVAPRPAEPFRLNTPPPGGHSAGTDYAAPTDRNVSTTDYAATDIADAFVRARHSSGHVQRALHQELVLAHLNLADSVAARYRRAGRDWSDLRQVARLGLVKAVSGFEPERGVHFVSYAVPTMSGEVKRYLRDHGWMIRPPRRLQELRAQVIAVKPELSQYLRREPRIDEIANALGQERHTVEEAMLCEGSLQPTSFDARTSDSDLRALSETLGAADENLDRAEEVAGLACALRELTSWERRLLHLRYFEDRTQQEIADEMGISQMQVSRVLTALLQRLRIQLGSFGYS